MLDASDGTLLWAFDPDGLGDFPIDLADPERLARSRNQKPQQQPAMWSGRSHQIHHHGGHISHTPQTHVVPYIPSTNSGMTATQFAIGSVAAAWSRPEDVLVNRYATVSNGNLILIGQNGMASLDLRLPIKPRQTWFGGQTLGSVAGMMVSLRHDEVLFMDPVTGDDHRTDLAAIGSARGKLTAAVVDGSRVYAIGPRGIVAMNARSGTILASGSWPQRNNDDLSNQSVANLAYTTTGVIAYHRRGPQPGNLIDWGRSRWRSRSAYEQ